VGFASLGIRKYCFCLILKEKMYFGSVNLARLLCFRNSKAEESALASNFCNECDKCRYVCAFACSIRSKFRRQNVRFLAPSVSSQITPSIALFVSNSYFTFIWVKLTNRKISFH
jgi:hypothetical protein